MPSPQPDPLPHAMRERDANPAPRVAATHPPSRFAARLAYLAYDLAGGLAALAALPALPWLTRRGYGDGVGERLGQLPDAAAGLGRPPFWIHSASVGETRSAAPLVARLRERYPGCPLVVSTTTVTGREVARADLRPEVTTLLPVDALHVIDRAFRRLRPRALFLVETELWPGLLRAANAVGAVTAVVSGRLSERALQRYRWAGPLFPAALARVAAFGMQSAADAERIVSLGAPPERVRVTGSLKASLVETASSPAPLSGLDGRRVLIAASTQPGEEEFVLQAFGTLRRVYRDALLIIAPRRPERFDEVQCLIAATRLPFARRSALGTALAPEVQVLLLDTVGELVRFFPSAWAVFVGGTIAPLGGHNVLEPAAHAKAVAFGPHTDNVAEAAQALRTAGGGALVQTPGELAEYWDGLLACQAAAEAAGVRARGVAASRAESLERTWAMVAPLLGATPCA
jgi:3-deoxy-D-manno-octulosonic-acid transferase